MGNIYLSRHGETDFNVKKIYQGIGLDIPLNEKGKRDAQKIREIFKDAPLDIILASPALRTIETATPTADEKGLSIINDWNLRERDHGPLVGKSYAHLGNMDVNGFLCTEAKYLGEDMEQVYMRAKSQVKKLIDEFSDKDVMVMSHGFMILMMCCAINNEGPLYKPKYVLDNGRFHHYRIEEGQRILEVGLNLEKLLFLPS